MELSIDGGRAHRQSSHRLNNPRVGDKLTAGGDPRLLLAHTHVFFKRSGEEPRPDFGSLMKAMTMKLIHREVAPHAFRAGTIAAYHEQNKVPPKVK